MLNPDDLRELAMWLRRLPRSLDDRTAENLENVAALIESDRKDGHKLARAFNHGRKAERTEQRSLNRSVQLKVKPR